MPVISIFSFLVRKWNEVDFFFVYYMLFKVNLCKIAKRNKNIAETNLLFLEQENTCMADKSVLLPQTIDIASTQADIEQTFQH